MTPPPIERLASEPITAAGEHDWEHAESIRRTAKDRNDIFTGSFFMPPAGLEPATLGLEVRRSIQLSYGGAPAMIPDGRLNFADGAPLEPNCAGTPDPYAVSSHRVYWTCAASAGPKADRYTSGVHLRPRGRRRPSPLVDSHRRGGRPGGGSRCSSAPEPATVRQEDPPRDRRHGVFGPRTPPPTRNRGRPRDVAVSTTIRLPRRRDGRAEAATAPPEPGARPPRRRRKRLLYTAGVLIAAVIVFFALNAVYGFTTGSSNAAGSRLTATVKRGTVLSSVSASGNVAVAQSASANFATSGTITAVYVSAGEHVKAGQALAKIDPTSARNALASAKANLAMAESTLASAQSGLTTAQRAANAISIQQAQLAVTTDEQQLGTDQTALATAKAQLARDAKLGFPASTTSSGNTLHRLGQRVHRLGQHVHRLGQRVHRLGQRVHRLGQRASTGSGSASTGSGSASARHRRARAARRGSAAPGDARTHSVLSSATGTHVRRLARRRPRRSRLPSGPTVMTGSASAVGTSSATLSGSVTRAGWTRPITSSTAPRRRV